MRSAPDATGLPEQTGSPATASGVLFSRHRPGRPRGALRVFLGAAPGVGKTYEMLEDARARIAAGADIVIAVVHTHGRAGTAAMTDGVDSVPLRHIRYRGVELDEMDIDAVIARDPAIALVDEMAHTNVPGSRNPKRWNDIDDLRDAGIEVWTTINIQHLASINDVVTEITGVVQHETVPDEAVRDADEIELVDIAPQALRQRLADGQVYAPARAEGALANYFRAGNLTALRELALLWLADQVDDALARYRASHHITATWEARERVVVAITGGAESATLIRRARRIASRSSAELIVVRVVRGDGLLGPDRATASGLDELAQGFGTRIHTVVGDDVAATLLDFARGVNATQLVLGASRRSRWQKLIREGVSSAVLRMSGKIDVHMVTHEHIPAHRRLDIRGTRLHRPLSWLLAVVIPFVAAGVISGVDKWMSVSSESALFFVAILAVSLLGGVGPAVLSALLSGMLLNYLFTAPRHSLTIAQPTNAITIAVMLIVAVAVSMLVDSAARRRVEAGRAAREAELLAAFSGAVLGGADLPALLEQFREVYDQRGVTLFRREDAEGGAVGMAVEASVGTDAPRRPESADTTCPASGEVYSLSMNGPILGGDDRRVLTAVATQAAGIAERRRLSEEASQARALTETDRLRRALLTAVSHDLRTPLAAIKAAASSLRGTDVEFSPEDTEELLATIEESTDHLTAVIGNLLDSSRLAAGVISPRLQTVYLGEVVARVIAGIAAHSPRTADRVVADVVGQEAWADQGLTERVLANVVDNALRHGSSGSGDNRVEVAAVADGHRCRITVADHGPGIPEHMRERVFEAFTRKGDRNSVAGVGLGLSVARGFAEAMDGRIGLRDTPGGGLTVVIDLPRYADD